MVDKEAIRQILGCLMKKPSLLSEQDKYLLTTTDFPTLFEQYIFSAIYNLYQDGAQRITEVDVDNYLNIHPSGKAIFQKYNGVEYLQDALDYCQEDNFPFYYKRVKKFNCLNDLKKLGFDTSSIYEENIINPQAAKINKEFEELEVKDIFYRIKKEVIGLETKYSSGEASEIKKVSERIMELVKELKVTPEVGSPLQGKIFNTICRGARASKFYIRSMSSGVGKTRSAVGDACMLSYPIRFNTQCWQWERYGSNEKTLFIATEQDTDEIQTLILAYLTGFNEEKILYGDYNEEEWKVIVQAIKVMEVFKDNFIIVRLSNPNIEQIKAVVRQSWVVYNIQNVFYDYIFSSPSLLTEFRDLKIREDVALGMLSTALKDLAVEMGLFIMSATQTNAKSEDNDKKIKNESVVRGARSIIDKCDIACVVSRVTPEEEERLKVPIEEMGLKPNQVLDVYKVRRGRYTNVKIWSYVDLGTCRKEDLFITDEKGRAVENFKTINFSFTEEEDSKIPKTLNGLNSELESGKVIEEIDEETDQDVLTQPMTSAAEVDQDVLTPPAAEVIDPSKNVEATPVSLPQVEDPVPEGEPRRRFII